MLKLGPAISLAVRNIKGPPAVINPPAGPFDALYPGDWLATTDKVLRTTPALTYPATKYSDINIPSYTDPTFGTKIYRISDVSDQTNVGTSRMRHEYSRRTPANCDSTKYILQNGSGYFFVYDLATGTRLNGGRTAANAGQYAIGLDTAEDPRDPTDWCWHATDPNKIIHISGFKFYEYDVVTHVRTVVRDLEGRFDALGMAGATSVSMGGEGRPSTNTRYWGFKVLNGTTNIGLIVYDFVEDTIVGSMLTNTNPNNVTMSPLGTYIIASNFNSTHTFAECQATTNLDYRGTQAWTRDFSKRTTLHCSSQHADPGIDAYGDEVYVSSSYEGTRMPDVTSGWVFMRRIRDGVAVDLVRNYEGNLYNQHVSTTMVRDRPGWFVWSTYHDTNRGEEAWKDAVVALVELKPNPKAIRVAHHRTTRTTYWQEPHACMSPDGNLVFYSCTWDNSDANPGGASGIPLSYMVALPSWIWDSADGQAGVGTPEPTYVNALSNSTYDTSTGWSTSASGVAISGGQVTMTGTSSVTCWQTAANMTRVPVSGETVRFRFRLTAYTEGSINPRIALSNGTFIYLYSGDSTGNGPLAGSEALAAVGTVLTTPAYTIPAGVTVNDAAMRVTTRNGSVDLAFDDTELLIG